MAPTGRSRAAAARTTARHGNPAPRRETVLTKAFLRAGERLGVPRAVLARIVGRSQPTLSRMHAGGYELEEGTKEWELALLFVRLYRSLDSIVGTDEAARAWLTGSHAALGGVPLDLVQTTEGLVRVVHYLDAHRAVV
ncbi:MAG: antitoxin Xre/MbcA/ParS toxin-binding domain-containing protein [Planctomycetia bacterium]